MFRMVFEITIPYIKLPDKAKGVGPVFNITVSDSLIAESAIEMYLFATIVKDTDLSSHGLVK